jgi:hypothetical protein
MADDKGKPTLDPETELAFRRLVEDFWQERTGERALTIIEGKATEQGTVDDQEDLLGIDRKRLELSREDEIGPNLRGAREEEARQESAAEQEKARQESAAKREESRGDVAAKNHRETQKTLRLVISAAVVFGILIISSVLLVLGGVYHWPSEAYWVIGGFAALTLTGAGVVAVKQAKPEK